MVELTGQADLKGSFSYATFLIGLLAASIQLTITVIVS